MSDKEKEDENTDAVVWVQFSLRLIVSRVHRQQTDGESFIGRTSRRMDYSCLG